MTLLATGCGGGVAVNEIVWQDPAVDLSWPAPPDPPRISYLRSLTGPSDFKIKGKGNVINELEKNEAIDKKLLRYLTVRVKKFDLEANYFAKREDDDKKESYKN